MSAEVPALTRLISATVCMELDETQRGAFLSRKHSLSPSPPLIYVKLKQGLHMFLPTGLSEDTNPGRLTKEAVMM